MFNVSTVEDLMDLVWEAIMYFEEGGHHDDMPAFEDIFQYFQDNYNIDITEEAMDLVMSVSDPTMLTDDELNYLLGVFQVSSMDQLVGMIMDAMAYFSHDDMSMPSYDEIYEIFAA